MMENLDIIILTTILSTLFVVFGIVVYREIKNNGFKSEDIEKSPRADMIRFIGRLFDEESIKPSQKAKLYQAVKRTIADMESDGVYFSDEVKEELKKKKEQMICEYSGLPSVVSYLKGQNKNEEHYQEHS